MWMMILMSGRWYAKEFDGEEHLRDSMDEVFIHVGEGTVVCFTDDLETFCDELRVLVDNIVIVEG